MPVKNVGTTPPSSTEAAEDDDIAVPRDVPNGDERNDSQAARDATPSTAPGDEGPVRVVRGYTAPPAAVRQTVLADAGARGAVPGGDAALGGGGREAAEAMAGAATGFVGQSGLSAPQPTVAGVVVSRPGLQEGPASGLGFASPFNILTPQANPLSGVNGRCTDLIHAGFFGGSRSACTAHFLRP